MTDQEKCLAEQVHVNRDVREGRADLAERRLARMAGVAAATYGGGVRVAGAVAPRDRAAALVDVDYLARGKERAELFRERVEQHVPAAHRGLAADLILRRKESTARVAAEVCGGVKLGWGETGVATIASQLFFQKRF